MAQIILESFNSIVKFLFTLGVLKKILVFLNIKQLITIVKLSVNCVLRNLFWLLLTKAKDQEELYIIQFTKNASAKL